MDSAVQTNEVSYIHMRCIHVQVHFIVISTRHQLIVKRKATAEGINKLLTDINNAFEQMLQQCLKMDALFNDFDGCLTSLTKQSQRNSSLSLKVLPRSAKRVSQMLKELHGISMEIVDTINMESDCCDTSSVLSELTKKYPTEGSFVSYNPIKFKAVDVIFVLVPDLNGDKDAFTNAESGKSMMVCLRSSFPRSRVVKYCHPHPLFRHYVQNEPLADGGSQFLQGLLPFVKGSDCSIHFIGHSMGGLVIKQCLWTASQSNDDRYKNIYHRTKSAAFYATRDSSTHLSANFNKIAKNIRNGVKILSVIPVQYYDFDCGLNEIYATKQHLGYDQNEIQRPLTIKDERYTTYYKFVTNSVPNAEHEIIQCSPKVRSQIDDDEKIEEYDQNKILCLHPDDDEIDDLYIAMRAFEQTENIETWSAILAQMLKRDSLNFKQQKLEKIFKDDVIKQNKQILDEILSKKKITKHIKREKIENSLNLSMEYWDSLKESKGAIKLKKSEIESLIDCSKEWHKLIVNQRKLKKGERMNDDENDYISEYVCNAFSKWFSDEPKLVKIKKKWRLLIKKLT